MDRGKGSTVAPIFLNAKDRGISHDTLDSAVILWNNTMNYDDDDKIPNDESADCPLTDLKPGDIIIAYVRGVHEVISIERRYVDAGTVDWACNKGKKLGDEKSPLIHYRRRLNSNGNKAPNQECSCDASYCHKVTQKMIDEEYAKTMKKAQKLKKAMELLLTGEKPIGEICPNKSILTKP